MLQLLFSEYLYRRFTEAAEGHLTKSRARLVSGEALAVYAQSIGLGDHLMMGRGDESSGGRRRASTLADAFEALVGAIYLDGGLGAARSFVLTQAREPLSTVHQQPPLEINPKGRLQEILQALPPAEGGDSAAPRNPTYRIIAQSGPDHAKIFTAQVDWNGLELGRGQGASKQQAESAAAMEALRSRSWPSAGVESKDGLPAAVG